MVKRRLRVARRVVGWILLLGAYFTGFLMVPVLLLGALLAFNTPEPVPDDGDESKPGSELAAHQEGNVASVEDQREEESRAGSGRGGDAVLVGGTWARVSMVLTVLQGLAACCAVPLMLRSGAGWFPEMLLGFALAGVALLLTRPQGVSIVLLSGVIFLLVYWLAPNASGFAWLGPERRAATVCLLVWAPFAFAAALAWRPWAGGATDTLVGAGLTIGLCLVPAVLHSSQPMGGAPLWWLPSICAGGAAVAIFALLRAGFWRAGSGWQR